ncbi:CaiB/BaiF CoA transferase family protein [Streptomyces sp. NPDC092296]|uniref:CaiB/BaiF CoA transferase family protein n=1 Tax=Streptomyces sp. NPDC092296 TaxID=3366012 RepID=UPI00380C5195
MGPLDGIRVIELASTAPCAFAGALLADLGADVVRIDRPQHTAPAADAPPPADPLARGKRSAALDLKDPADRDTLLGLLDRADVFLEGLRPGGCERLGLGPDVLRERNPRLVYARVTGWGQQGPWAERPGHDLTFLAMAGALDADRAPGAAPLPPSTYLSSFAGGGMLQVLGVLAALTERASSGLGQTVDAAMVDGAALLTVMIRQWRRAPGNHTVTDAPFYTTYACKDGRHLAVAAIEPRFWTALLTGLGLADRPLPDRADPAAWPQLQRLLAEVFLERESEHWIKTFDGLDACVVPVLTVAEAAEHPALHGRRAYTDVAGLPQPSPAPRFDRTPTEIRRPAPVPGRHTAEILTEWTAPAPH